MLPTTERGQFFPPSLCRTIINRYVTKTFNYQSAVECICKIILKLKYNHNYNKYKDDKIYHRKIIKNKIIIIRYILYRYNKNINKYKYN